MKAKRLFASQAAVRADRDDIDPAWSRRKTLFCLSICAALVLLIGTAQIASMVIPVAHFKTPEAAARFAAARSIDHAFVWDAGWYDSIAKHGYSLAKDASGRSNTAFFPLWPLLVRCIYALCGAAAAGRTVVIVLAAAIACGSIFALHRLACFVLRPAAARWATLLYAFNPAAHFMFQSYPTGVMNLLAILALDCLVRRRFWRAAGLGGVASAAGPLGALLAPTVVLAVLNDRQRAWAKRDGGRPWLRGAGMLAGLSVLCLSGVLVFIAFLYIRLGAPLAFATAQDSWMKALPLFERLAKLLYFEIFPMDFRDAWRDGVKLWHVWRATGWQNAEYRFEALLGSVGIGLGLAGAWSAVWVRPRWLAFYAGSVISAYIWLIATNVDSQAALRHIYVAVPSFFGLARVVYWSPWAARGMVGLSGAALGAEVMLSYRGYWVV